MVKLSKQCNNCHLDVDIDPLNPPSLCPFCGKEMLYSIEETKQIKLAEEAIEEKSNALSESTLASKTSKEVTVFTPANKGIEYKRLAIGLAAVLCLIVGYFVFNFIRFKNTQTAVSQNASYEAAANNNLNPMIQKSTATPTHIPEPTATPTLKPIYAPPAKAYIGRNYQEVKNEFRIAGFKKIETIELHDMLIDIGGTHIGAVESISIRGNIAYDEKTPYNETDTVRIYYHSLK